MKKGLFALAASLLFFACNDGDKTVGDGDEATTKATFAGNSEVYKAVQSGNVAGLDSFLTEDVIDHEGNMGKDIVGRDSVKHYLSQMHNYFDNMKMEVLSEATSNDNLYHFTLVRMTGKTKQNPWGMPVGQEMDDTGIDLVKLKDGKISEHWSFTSQKDMMEMMGNMGGDQHMTVRDSTKK
jgi:predicted SnoaL-like aldol condensation-catalyzing enzyme